MMKRAIFIEAGSNPYKKQIDREYVDKQVGDLDDYFKNMIGTAKGLNWTWFKVVVFEGEGDTLTKCYEKEWNILKPEPRIINKPKPETIIKTSGQPAWPKPNIVWNK